MSKTTKGTMSRRIGALITAGIVATGVATNHPNAPEKMPARVNEVVEQRTATSYTVQRQDGKMQAIVHTRPIHWRDGEGNWRRPDLRVKGRPWLTGLYSKYEAEVTAGPYEAKFDNDNLGDYRFEAGGSWIEYDLQTDVVVDFETESHSVKEYVTLQSGDPDTLVWQVTGSRTPLWDGAVLTVPGSDIRTQPLVAWDAADNDVQLGASYFAGRLTVAVDTVGVAWPVVVDPSTTVEASGDGTVSAAESSSYSDARDASTGFDAISSALYVGQNTGSFWRVKRSFLSFDMPNISTISACTLYVNGSSDLSSTDFDIYIHTSTYGGTIETSDFDLFDGRQTGTAHTGTVLNETWNSSSYSADWNTIVFNAAGLDSLEEYTDNQFRIAMISKEDYDNSPPAASEQVYFDSSYDAGTEPYLSVTFATMSYEPVPTGFALHSPTDSTIAASWTVHHSADVDSQYIVDDSNTWLETTSGKQDSSITLTGLTPATEYIRKVAVDSTGTSTGYSNADTLYTLAEAPASIAVTENDSTHITITLGTGSNPDSTYYAVKNSYWDNWYTATGDTASSEAWVTAPAWEAKTLLVPKDANLTVSAKAKNGDGVETALTESASFSTNNKKTFLLSAVAENHYNSSSPNYADARGETSPDSIDASGSAQVGQANGETVYRWYASWRIPNADSITAAKIVTTGVGDNSATDFNLRGFISKWEQGDTATDKFWDFYGYKAGITAYDGTNLLESWNSGTDYQAGADSLDINSAGLDSLENAGGDTLGIAILSSRDVAGTAPTGNEYVGLSGADLLLTYYQYDYPPSGISVTEIDADSVLVEWTDNSTTEDGFIVADLADSTAIADTTAANATSARIGGLVPNTLYRLIVGVYGGKVDGQYSSDADSAYTDAVAPGAPGLVFTSSDTMKVIPDTTGTGNPSYTEYAVQDSITGYYVDYTADPDTLDTSGSEVWGTRADWGDTIRVDITDYIGRLFGMRWKARSGQ